MQISIRWLWLAMIGGSLFLAMPGNSRIDRVLGDVVGHLFSALLLASIPIVGYYFLYKRIGEKEVTLIVGAAWAYLVISKFLGL
ncbi:MAG: hypothetical protein MRJ96_05250 [Nitrospirales bacterium]|nr:hypothetical protein [Nitrospira sp.]MDR4500842.1 hypothetical protein [Nitrospirales bacterium]